MVNFVYVMFIVVLFFIAWIVIWNWLSNKKSKKSKTKNIRICPKCKSKDVSPDFSQKTFGEQSEFNKFKCNDCGYSSIFFPEVGKRKIKKSQRNKKI